MDFDRGANQESCKKFLALRVTKTHSISLIKIAKLADEEDHHPQIILEWGKVTVTWWSHKIEGLHHNDFICAAKTDQLFK